MWGSENTFDRVILSWERGRPVRRLLARAKLALSQSASAWLTIDEVRTGCPRSQEREATPEVQDSAVVFLKFLIGDHLQQLRIIQATALCDGQSGYVMQIKDRRIARPALRIQPREYGILNII